MEEILVSSGVLRKKDEGIEETVGQVGMHSGQDFGTPFSYWCGGGGGTQFHTADLEGTSRVSDSGTIAFTVSSSCGENPGER